MLKPLRLNSEEYDPYLRPYVDECKRIQRILANEGYEATIEQCFKLWNEYSDTYAAGWLMMPENDNEIFGCIRKFIVED